MWDRSHPTLRSAPLVILCTALAIGAPADAGEPANRPTIGTALTESVALRLALADAAFDQLQEARVDAARSEVIEAGLPPNPVLGLEYQRFNGQGDPTEATARLSQTFDTSGRRALREQGAAARLESTRSQADADRIERRAQVLTRFYESLYAQERGAVLRAWEARIGAAAKVVRDRAGAGEASGYDLRRLEHERALARAERDEAAAQLAQRRESLLVLLDGATRRYGTVTGRLLPSAPSSLDRLTDGLERRPDLVALRQREQAAQLGRRAGERGGIPDVTVGLGTKRASEADRDDWGLVLDLSIPLTLFDRGQAVVARADAEARTVAGEHVLAMREAQGSLRGLWQKATELQRAAGRLKAIDTPHARTLAQTAQSGYQAGEIGILELLDAQRVVRETELRALDLALEARLATIELARVSGGIEQ